MVKTSNKYTPRNLKTRKSSLAELAVSKHSASTGVTLNEGRVRVDLRKKFFTVRVVRPGVPGELVNAPSLGTSQARLDGALSTLTQLEMSLLAAGGWTGWPGKVPSHPNPSMIL